MKDCNKKSVEKADSIDELATLICGYGYYANHNDDRNHPIPKDAVKEYLEMGASFARQQMMKNAVEAEVIAPHGRKLVEHDAVVCSGKMATPFPAEIMDKFDIGDQVKLIIIKEE